MEYKLIDFRSRSNGFDAAVTHESASHSLINDSMTKS
jgi:hypothetical protein